MDKLVQVIKVLRPVHWIKNLAIFGAIFLTGLLFEPKLLPMVIWGFICFSFATSSAYVVNDILDAGKDKLHPIKKNRPIAAGKLSVATAIALAFFLASISLFISATISHLFFLITASYLTMQVGYSLGLKNIPVIDILIIASGFILRVYGGAVIIDAHLSVWFLLCVVSTALFLASGKRRAELNIPHAESGLTRTSLRTYKKQLLNSYVTMFGNASWMSWSLYTFFESPKASLPFWLTLAEISKATTINKLMMVTIPIVIFGIMKYESLIFAGKSEAPEKLLLTDKGLISAIVLWTAVIYWIIYSGVSVGGI